MICEHCNGTGIKPVFKVNVSAEVREVFDYWVEKCGHERAKLSRERVAKIKGRLKDGFTVDDLKLAIDGCKLSPFHAGVNETGTVYDSIELIARNTSKVEFFMNIAKGGGNGQSKENYYDRKSRESAERQQVSEHTSQFFN